MLDTDTGEVFGLSLATLDGGGAVEMFDHALEAVLDNLQDPNTDPKAVRKVVLTVSIKPSKGAKLGVLTYKVQPTLAPTTPVELGVFLEKDDDGKGYASESSPLERHIAKTKAEGQGAEGEPSDKVRSIHKED